MKASTVLFYQLYSATQGIPNLKVGMHITPADNMFSQGSSAHIRGHNTWPSVQHLKHRLSQRCHVLATTNLLAEPLSFPGAFVLSKYAI